LIHDVFSLYPVWCHYNNAFMIPLKEMQINKKETSFLENFGVYCTYK
jgi:hypothetical protein